MTLMSVILVFNLGCMPAYASGRNTNTPPPYFATITRSIRRNAGIGRSKPADTYMTMRATNRWRQALGLPPPRTRIRSF